MASNGIVLIDNQPIQLYKVAPTDSELALGMTAWSQSAYHKRLGNCGFIGPDYCNPVLDTDFMTFQFKLPTTGSNVVPGLSSSVLVNGTNTAPGSFQLIDSGASFVSAGVEVDNVVVNSSDNTSSFVQVVSSGTQLDLDHDIFTTNPLDYYVLSWKGSGEWKYNINTGVISMASPSPTTLYTEGVLTTGKIYKVTINVTSVTSGNFQIKLGTNSIATINSVGTHVFYGECITNPDFILQASSAFTGTIVDSIEVLEVSTVYTVGIFDTDGNYITSISQDAYGSDTLAIGNALVNIEWGNFSLECGAYVVGIYSGDVTPCPGQMITNGNFSGLGGWSVNDSSITITVTPSRLNFEVTPEGGIAENSLQCNIIAGHTYTVSYDVFANSNNDKDGTYGILTAQGQISPSFNIAVQTGTVTFDFTASQDSDHLDIAALSEFNGAFDNISLLDITDLVQNDADSLSECYCVCDSQDCTILIKYKNENNAFGLFYDQNSPFNYFRISASILSSPIKDNELIQFKNTLHFMNIPYWDGMKVFTLATDLLPAWVHNTLSTVLKHRELYMDSVRYVGIEEHTYNEEQTEVFGSETKIALWNQQNLNNAY